MCVYMNVCFFVTIFFLIKATMETEVSRSFSHTDVPTPLVDLSGGS